MENINLLIDGLYSKYKTYNPFELADHYNLSIKYVPFDEEPQGEVVHILGKTFILLNETLSDTNYRYFICAHELFHAINHMTDNNYRSNSNKKGSFEGAADYFAVKLAQSYYYQLNNKIAKKPSDLNFFGVQEKISIDLVY